MTVHVGRYIPIRTGLLLVALAAAGCEGDLEVQRLLSAGNGSANRTVDATDVGMDGGADDATTDGSSDSDSTSEAQRGDGGATDSGDASTSGTDDSTTDGNQGPALATVSFATHVQPIFNSYCIRCHVTGGFANQSGIPLKLVEGVSYRLLVNQSSAQRSDLKLVLPSHPDNSLLYMKLTQDPPPVGVMMPWDRGPAPTPEEVQKIRTWIEEGAQFN